MALTLEIRGQDGKLLDVDGEVLVLHELLDPHRQLEIRLAAATAHPPRARLGALELPWHAAGACFIVDKKLIAQWVGGIELVVSAGDEDAVLWLEIEPRPRKARPHEWHAMLGQLESWLGGITVGQEAGQRGAVSDRGASAPLLAEALTPLLPAFAQALHEITLLPVRGAEDTWQLGQLHTARRLDRETARWLGRRPALRSWLRDRRSQPEPLVLQHRAAPTLDHPGNRYVGRLVHRVVATLRSVVEQLRALAAHYKKNKSLNHTSQWCAARASTVEQHADVLDRLWRRSFLRHLGLRRTDLSALGAIIDHPTYARIHQLGRLILSPRFRLPEEPTRSEHRPAAVRSSFHLYELWTFLFVQRCLVQRLPSPDWSWSADHLDRLFDLTDEGSSVRFVATGPAGGTLEIRFNEWFHRLSHKQFATWTHDAHASGCYSLAPRQRPDIIVCHRRPGQAGRWICLDAKYYEPDKLGNPMKAMHRYRSSLWMRGHGGRCQAGALLVPRCRDNELWATPEFRDQFDIGLWQCRPGDPPDPHLADWLLGHLGIALP